MKVVSMIFRNPLLGEIIRAAEQRHRGCLAVDQELHPPEQHALLERQIDLVGRQILLERLDGRIMAPGLEPDRDRHAGEVGGS
jgi:hypothetical protein